MLSKLPRISIITLTFNCFNQLDDYWQAFSTLDRSQFDWIVIDGLSTDGTAEWLKARAEAFDFFASEPDAGFYFALNKAIAKVTTDYYMVFGADDRPSPHLLQRIFPLLNGAALILGGVKIIPNGGTKLPGARGWHPFVWGRAVSHHSVGTAINIGVHKKYGNYDTAYRLVADGALLKQILASKDSIVRTNEIFGSFALGGMSSKQELRSIVESFQLQMAAGSNPALQLLLLNARLIKLMLKNALF